MNSTTEVSTTNTSYVAPMVSPTMFRPEQPVWDNGPHFGNGGHVPFRGFLEWLERGDTTALHILQQAYDEEISRVWDEAQALNLELQLVSSADSPEEERRATDDELKEVTAARQLGATPQQLTRIRAILEERNSALTRVEKLQAQLRQLQSDEIAGDDERLIPFWASAARAATAAGYCPEYDRIAEATGGRSREWLQDNGYLSLTYRVRIRAYGYVQVEATDPDSALSEVNDAYINDLEVEWDDESPHATDWSVVED